MIAEHLNSTDRVVPGSAPHRREALDRVLVELSPYDLNRGRILFRYRT